MQQPRSDVRDRRYAFRVDAAGSPNTASDSSVDDTIRLDARTPHPPGRFSTQVQAFPSLQIFIDLSHSPDRGLQHPPIQEYDAPDVVNEICATLGSICLDDAETLQKVESAALILSTLQAHDGLDVTVNAILDSLPLKGQDAIMRQTTGQIVSIIRRASAR